MVTLLRLGFFHTANFQSKGILRKYDICIFKSKGLLFDALGEKQHDQEQKLL